MTLFRSSHAYGQQKMTVHSVRVDPNGVSTTINKKRYEGFTTIDGLVDGLAASPAPPDWPVSLTYGLDVFSERMLLIETAKANSETRRASSGLNTGSDPAAGLDADQIEPAPAPMALPVTGPVASITPATALSTAAAPSALQATSLPTRSRWVHIADVDVSDKEALKGWAVSKISASGELTRLDNGKFVLRAFDEQRGLFQLCVVYKGKMTIHSVSVSSKNGGAGTRVQKKFFGNLPTIDAVVTAFSVSPGLKDGTGRPWPAPLIAGANTITGELEPTGNVGHDIVKHTIALRDGLNLGIGIHETKLGLIITRVTPGKLADTHGVQPNRLILSINGIPTTSMSKSNFLDLTKAASHEIVLKTCGGKRGHEAAGHRGCASCIRDRPYA